MPKSDTWPGVIVPDTMKEMDSAGSCDSVVSINSTFSDDSLEYLSPEERACLMFLEETIESLETEEDSGLSNDEPDHLPMPGNLAARMANLSASMSKSKITDVSISRKAEVAKNNNNKPGQDHTQVHNYLVPTPLVLANGDNISKNGIVPRGLRSPKPTRAAVNGHDHTDSHVFVVLKVTSGTTDYTSLLDHKPEQERGPERSNPRGPLSYGDLVQLRKAACDRKGQETCATLEDKDKQPSKPIKHIPLECDSTHAPTDQLGTRKPVVPPAVAPKPKRIPTSIPVSPTAPGTDKCPMNPQKVRLEALYKLGLLKDQQSSTAPCPSQPDQCDWARPPGFPPPRPPASKPALDPFHSKQGPTPPAAELIARKTTHWTSGVVHHRSMSDMSHIPQPVSARPAGGKSVTLERSGLGLGSSFSSQSFCERKDGKSTTLIPRAIANGVLPHGKPRSKTLESLKDECTGSGSGVGRLDRSASFQTRPQASGVKGHVHSQSATSGVQLPPRMAEERREALRKLGLLKD